LKNGEKISGHAVVLSPHFRETRKMPKHRLVKRIVISTAALFSAMLLYAVILSSADSEVIQCTAQGTSTQLGRSFSLKITIDEYSPEEDRQLLIQGFQKNKNQGLYDALRKLQTRGRVQTPETVGYQLKFIRLLPNSPPGTRKIRIMTDRPIGVAETMYQGRSLDYTISVVDLELNDVKEKSTGILLPLCEFKLDKKTKELSVEVRKNPFKLINFFNQK
jgi:hypothetical protein